MTAWGLKDGEVALGGGLNPSLHPEGWFTVLLSHWRMLHAEC